MKKRNYLATCFIFIFINMLYVTCADAHNTTDKWRLFVQRQNNLPQKCVMQRDVSLQHLSKKKIKTAQFEINALQSPYNPFEIRLIFPKLLNVSSVHIHTPLPLSGKFEKQAPHVFALRFIYLPRTSDRKTLLSYASFEVRLNIDGHSVPLSIPLEGALQAYHAIYNTCFPNPIRGFRAIAPPTHTPQMPQTSRPTTGANETAESKNIGQQLFQLNPETIINQFIHNDILEKFGLEINPDL